MCVCVCAIHLFPFRNRNRNRNGMECSTTKNNNIRIIWYVVSAESWANCHNWKKKTHGNRWIVIKWIHKSCDNFHGIFWAIYNIFDSLDARSTYIDILISFLADSIQPWHLNEKLKNKGMNNSHQEISNLWQYLDSFSTFCWFGEWSKWFRLRLSPIF